jgi:hypothetical protein
MKKYLFIVSLLGLFILTACGNDIISNDAGEAGIDYAPDAFQALKDEVNQPLTIDAADFACATVIVDDQNESTCTYVIALTTNTSNQILYAFVVVSDDDGNDPVTFVQVYGREENYTEMLDLIYSDSFQSDTRDDMKDDDTIEAFDFNVDQLSQDAIDTAYSSVQ